MVSYPLPPGESFSSVHGVSLTFVLVLESHLCHKTGVLSVLVRAWEVFGGKSGEKSVCGVLTVVETILLQSCGWSRTRCLPENPFQASMVSF